MICYEKKDFFTIFVNSYAPKAKNHIRFFVIISMHKQENI